MVLDGDPACFGKTLIDLKVAAIGRKAAQSDRRRVIDELQRRLQKQEDFRFRCGLTARAPRQ
jgi:hypothetical protein